MKRKVKKKIKVVEGRGSGRIGGEDNRINQQVTEMLSCHLSPGQRSALTSQVCASASLWSFAWHALCYNNALLFFWRKKKRKEKKSQTDTSARMRQMHACTHTHLQTIVVTRKNKCSKRQRPGARLKLHEEMIKRSNHINSGMTEGQRYAGLQKKNGGRCFP